MCVGAQGVLESMRRTTVSTCCVKDTETAVVCCNVGVSTSAVVLVDLGASVGMKVVLSTAQVVHVVARTGRVSCTRLYLSGRSVVDSEAAIV